MLVPDDAFANARIHTPVRDGVSRVGIGAVGDLQGVDAKGQVAYQNKPCPTGSDVAAIREYEPLSRDEAWRAEQERRQRIAAQAAANDRARAHAASTRTYVYTDKRPTTVQVRRKQCAAAKRERDQARRNAPMWRDVHYLEPWEVKVREACKGLW